MFTGRLRAEIPHCLTAFTEAILNQDGRGQQQDDQQQDGPQPPQPTPQLTTVDFSDNAFGPDGIRPLVPLLRQQTSLQVVRLNNTGLGPMGGPLLADALFDAAQKYKSEVTPSSTTTPSSSTATATKTELRVLVTGRSRLENGSMAAMAKALKAHAGLREVVLPQNGIRPEGIVVLLLEGLIHCPDLEVLDLQDNTFSTRGARALAKALPHWPRLRKLNVGDCLLKAKGSLAVVEALRQSEHPHLESLNLQYNEMTEQGALALATILKKYPKLTHLELNGNQFPEDGEGADAIRSALEEMEKPEEVLASLSDMEELDSDEEQEDEEETEEEAAEEEEEEEEEEAKVEDATDELASALGKNLSLSGNGAK